MGFFDFFKKKKKLNNKTIITIQKPSSNSTQTLDKTAIMYDGIEIDGELLKKVYAKNIVDGLFIVPKHIKSINAFAFKGLKELKTVVMHEQVRYIAPLAFQFCENLQNVVGLDKAFTMKTLNGFHCCGKLKYITLPQNIQLISEDAFVNCAKLKSINIPTGCWCISERAFMGCESLENVYIPATVELVSDFAFAGCKNLTITFIEDDKIYLQDFIEQQEKIKSQNTTDVDYLEEDYFKSTEEIKISDEDKQNLYDDLGIRYRKINIAGQEILWTSGKIIIKQNSLSGVKEVVVYSQEMLEKVINSGYDGKVTIISIDKNQKITFDFNIIKQYKKTKSQIKNDEGLEK